MNNNRREDGGKVESKRKLSLRNIQIELRDTANGRKNANFKTEEVFVVISSRGTVFCGRLKYFSVL